MARFKALSKNLPEGTEEITINLRASKGGLKCKDIPFQ